MAPKRRYTRHAVKNSKKQTSEESTDVVEPSTSNPQGGVTQEADQQPVSKAVESLAVNDNEDGTDDEEGDVASKFKTPRKNTDKRAVLPHVPSQLPNMPATPSKTFWKNNPQSEEEMCRLWRENEALYNTTMDEHKDTDLRNDIINQIAFALSVPPSYVTTHMDSMRNTFRKICNTVTPSGSSPKPRTNRQKTIFKLCSFLKRHIKHAPSLSSHTLSGVSPAKPVKKATAQKTTAKGLTTPKSSQSTSKGTTTPKSTPSTSKEPYTKLPEDDFKPELSVSGMYVHALLKSGHAVSKEEMNAYRKELYQYYGRKKQQAEAKSKGKGKTQKKKGLPNLEDLSDSDDFEKDAMLVRTPGTPKSTTSKSKGKGKVKHKLDINMSSPEEYHPEADDVTLYSAEDKKWCVPTQRKHNESTSVSQAMDRRTEVMAQLLSATQNAMKDSESAQKEKEKVKTMDERWAEMIVTQMGHMTQEKKQKFCVETYAAAFKYINE